MNPWKKYNVYSDGSGNPDKNNFINDMKAWREVLTRDSSSVPDVNQLTPLKEKIEYAKKKGWI